MRRYIISPPALRDLQEIIDRLSGIRLEAGEQFLSQFEAWCQRLRSFPTIGKPYDGLSVGLRGVILERYILFYRVNDEVVEIVRVVDGRRDLISLFNNN
ncbi:MAG: type II toxin-antitoxin system RelE/ParE family toxin [Phormidium sp. GEM2.Bin31]|nr:MAG: type II toxin-antitoxin system RelE/ParE family toxin [Phormidium sp. GEM2.Bin31]